MTSIIIGHKLKIDFSLEEFFGMLLESIKISRMFHKNLSAVPKLFKIF